MDPRDKASDFENEWPRHDPWQPPDMYPSRLYQGPGHPNREADVRTIMTLRAGREFLAIPGPTTIPDKVLRAMHRPAVDMYAGPLLALTDSLHRDIARVFQTEGRAYI
jgi:hypothetical protein